MPAQSTVQIVVSSVRLGRLCPAIAEWVAQVGRAETDLDFAILDLKDWHLPMDDEPGVPASGDPYKQEHTRAWSEMVAGADAFAIVTPQYNGGIPASLKNAMDHLYKEWAGKPVLIVSYGGHGGAKTAMQLRELAEGLKMRPVATMPALTLPKGTIGAHATLDPDAAFAESLGTVKQALNELETMMVEEPVAA